MIPPHWLSIFYSSLLLATTDPHSVPPKIHISAQKSTDYPPSHSRWYLNSDWFLNDLVIRWFQCWFFFSLVRNAKNNPLWVTHEMRWHGSVVLLESSSFSEGSKVRYCRHCGKVLKQYANWDTGKEAIYEARYLFLYARYLFFFNLHDW